MGRFFKEKITIKDLSVIILHQLRAFLKQSLYLFKDEGKKEAAEKLISQFRSNYTAEEVIEKFWKQDSENIIYEMASMYYCVIVGEVSRRFPKKALEIIREVLETLKIDEMLDLIKYEREYRELWNKAYSRKRYNDDGSPLNDPYYCLAKKATLRCFAENEGDWITPEIRDKPFRGEELSKNESLEINKTGVTLFSMMMIFRMVKHFGNDLSEVLKGFKV